MTVSSRIVVALKRGPMTAEQLKNVVYSTDYHVRHCLASLKRAGKVRQSGYAERLHNKGAIPRYWEVI